MIRDVFIRHPNPLQDESWISEIRALVGERWFNENNLTFDLIKLNKIVRN
jgi:hypothetical protein